MKIQQNIERMSVDLLLTRKHSPELLHTHLTPLHFSSKQKVAISAILFYLELTLKIA